MCINNRLTFHGQAQSYAPVLHGAHIRKYKYQLLELPMLIHLDFIMNLISTLYHLWMNFKTKNHKVYDLGFWLHAPKEDDRCLFSHIFMPIQLFGTSCDYSTIYMYMTHI